MDYDAGSSRKNESGDSNDNANGPKLRLTMPVHRDIKNPVTVTLQRCELTDALLQRRQLVLLEI